MAQSVSDRWLWLGVGVFFLCAAKGIQYAMNDVVKLTELDNSSITKQDDEEQNPEDALSLTTLRTLAAHPNTSISSAAKSLIVTRFASLPSALEILSTDAASKNDKTARQAKQAMLFLQDWDELLTSGMPLPDDLAWDATGEDVQYAGSREIENDMERHMLGRARARLHREEQQLTEQLQRLEAQIVERLEDVAEDPARRTAMEALRRGEWRLGEAPYAGWERIPVERPPVRGGGDEAERRRRRREAVVVHEGVDGVGEEDIIRPRST